MRYQKQEILSYIGNKQKILENKTVSVVGLGAIGSNTANLLARAGLNLNLIDRDVVELDNLQRQVLFDENDIGQPKAIQAKKKLSLINSEIKISSTVTDLNHTNINILQKSDIILDCTDNMETRLLINDFALYNSIPWIYSAVLGVHAMTMNIVPGKTPCFSCIFKEQTSITDNCDSVGVINTITTLIASIQSTEAIKILTDQEFNRDLLLLNIWELNIEKLKIKPNLNCKTCSGIFDYLAGKNHSNVLKFCGANSFQIRGKPINLEYLFERLGKSTKATLSFISNF